MWRRGDVCGEPEADPSAALRGDNKGAVADDNKVEAIDDVLGEDVSEADDDGGGFGDAFGVGGIELGGLMDERAVGGPRGDVGEGVRCVGGIDEVALEH